jgi:hypothetical protein
MYGADRYSFTASDPIVYIEPYNPPMDTIQNVGWENLSRFRLIAGAYKVPLSPANSTWSAGTLNLAPVGLGMLVTGNYMPDVRALYCPSSTDMPTDWWGGTRAKNYGASDLKDWMTAGGYDGNTLHYGNWWSGPGNTTLNRGYPYWSNRTVYVECSYNYRNVPLAIYNPWHSQDATYSDTAIPGRTDGFIDYSKNGTVNQGAYRLGGTSPILPVHLGQPFFPTTKVLGQRSIVSDTFSKGGGGSGGHGARGAVGQRQARGAQYAGGRGRCRGLFGQTRKSQGDLPPRR